MGRRCGHAPKKMGFIRFTYNTSHKTCIDNGMWGYSGSNAEAKPEAFFRDEARESRDASAANGKAEQISDPGGALLLEAIDYL